MKMWVPDEMGQSFSDVENADKVEIFAAFLASIFTINSPKVLCLDTDLKQRNNQQWQLFKSEISVTFKMLYRLREFPKAAKNQMLDSFFQKAK